MATNNHNPAKWAKKGVLYTVVMALRNGNSRTDAFRLAGVHPDTGFDWLRKGRDAPETYPVLQRLGVVCEKAEALFRRDQVAKVVEAAQSGAPNTWQAAMTLLERRDPENWGKRDRTIIEHEGDPLTQINVLVLEDPETRELSRDFLRRVTGARPNLALGPGVGEESPED